MKIPVDALMAAVKIIEQGVGAGMPVKAYQDLEAAMYAAYNATKIARSINRS